MSDPLISATDLQKTFGHTHAVDGGQFARGTAGEIFGLVGPDGAGKTTILRLLCGVHTPDAGQVSLGGFDLAHHAEKARELVGYLAQRYALYEELTVIENLRFFAEVRGAAAQRVGTAQPGNFGICRVIRFQQPALRPAIGRYETKTGPGGGPGQPSQSAAAR